VLGHIREYYSTWHQGLVAKLCQRYQQIRYGTELQVYLNMLEAYQTEGATVSAMQSFDV